MSKKDTWLELLTKVEVLEKKLDAYEKKHNTHPKPNETKDEWISRLNKQ